MTRIAVLSDIHGNIPALKAVVADLERRGVDTVVNLGDHVSGPLWPEETVRFLMEQDWLHIMGNHDRNLIQQEPDALGPSDAYAFRMLNGKGKEWLRSLPASLTVQDGVLLFHGTPSNDTEYLLETIEHGGVRIASEAEIRDRLGATRSPVMLCGHSHVQRLVRLGDMTIINPGSVGLPAYEDDGPRPHVVESGSPDARYAIIETGQKTCTAAFIAVPYDFPKAADQAGRNNRPDWAAGLQTGYMRL